MTFDQMVQALRAVQKDGEVFQLSPGPLMLKVGKQDAHAGHLLSKLVLDYPEITTFGKVEDALLSALWWLQFLAAVKTPQPKQEDVRTLAKLGFAQQQNNVTENTELLGKPIRDWAEGIAKRITDEIMGPSQEDLEVLQNVLTKALRAAPAECMRLVGTGIIETGYFDEI